MKQIRSYLFILIFLYNSSIFAQGDFSNYNIFGTIYSDSIALASAEISIPFLGLTTISDKNGNYNLAIPFPLQYREFFEVIISCKGYRKHNYRFEHPYDKNMILNHFYKKRKPTSNRYIRNKRLSYQNELERTQGN